MINHESLDEVQALAAAYALGTLDADAAAAFEAHLAQGCARCAGEVEAFQRVAVDLAEAGTVAAPPAAVRARVLRRAGADPSVARITRPGLLFIRTAATEWEQPGVAGVDIKLLAFDEVHGRTTQLVRLAPGSVYPPHRHAGTEELFLLEGDLLVSGVEMHAGDYCRAEPDSVHNDISSHGGCVFISTASVHDELIG